MKYLVCGNDALIQQWVLDTFGIICTKIDLAVAVIEDKAIVAAAFFQAHNGPDVELSYYGPNTMTLDVVKGLAKIAVDHLGVSRVTARTAKSNKKAAHGFRKIGFVYEGVRHHGYGEQDAVMYGLFGAKLAKLAGKEMQ